MRRSILAAALAAFLFTSSDAQEARGHVESEAAEDAYVGFDCPSGDPNPNRPEAKLAAGDVTKKARVLPTPAYTRGARAAGLSGLVRAEVLIAIDSGRVVWARVGDGHALLREAVRSIVCRAEFYPTVYVGPPARVSGVITYRFGVWRGRTLRRRGN